MPFTVRTEPAGFGLFWCYLTVSGRLFVGGGHGEARAISRAWSRAFAAGVRP